MSNERQETIADIVAEMLEFAETDSQSIGRDVLRRRIQHFARRIGEAAKREREAGADAAQICGEIGEMIGMEAACKEAEALDKAKSSLADPPRNCDRFSNANEALEAFEKETGETMIEFIRWLFADAKGVTK